jgi:CRP-like cAMP-binding protein
MCVCLLIVQLSYEEMQMIIRVMFRVDLEKGELIVRQGDQADNFYIIES